MQRPIIAPSANQEIMVGLTKPDIKYHAFAKDPQKILKTLYQHYAFRLVSEEDCYPVIILYKKYESYITRNDYYEDPLLPLQHKAVKLWGNVSFEYATLRDNNIIFGFVNEKSRNWREHLNTCLTCKRAIGSRFAGLSPTQIQNVCCQEGKLIYSVFCEDCNDLS